MTKPRYDILEHTADVGLKVYGRTLQELFVHAALGLVELAGRDEAPVAGANEHLPLSVGAMDLEDLLINWLSEVLYFMDAEGWIFRNFAVNRIAATSVEGEAIGERRDRAKDPRVIAVKAVTYHQISVRQTAEGWEAVVYFDI